jgi:hypothetical protein
MRGRKEIEMVNIEGLSKASVLAALYNGTHCQGWGFVQSIPGDMTEDAAQKILDTGQVYFDYLYGRVMKVNLSRNEFDPWGYDRDNYPGAAQDAINRLRNK